MVTDQNLDQPVGIDLIDDRMLISDYATGEIIIYDISALPATELTRIATDNPGITGIALGKDGRIWYVNNQTNELVKIEPDMISGVNTAIDKTPKLGVYPNPSNGVVYVYFPDAANPSFKLTVCDLAGNTVFTANNLQSRQAINLQHLPKGVYLFTVNNGETTLTRKVSLESH